MNTEVVKTEKLDLSVLTPEQGALLDKLKLYSKAEDKSRLERKMFAYLKGRTANALKEITDHKQFTALVAQTFPESTVRWLQFCMNFSTAVDTGKNAPVKFLPDNRLLKPGDLPEDEKEKVQHAIEKVTGDKGVMSVIKDWKKKIARDKAKEAGPVDAVKQEQERQKNITAIFQTLEANLRRVVELKDIDFVMPEIALRNSIARLAIRYGKRMKQTKAKAKLHRD